MIELKPPLQVAVFSLMIPDEQIITSLNDETERIEHLVKALNYVQQKITFSAVVIASATSALVRYAWCGEFLLR